MNGETQIDILLESSYVKRKKLQGYFSQGGTNPYSKELKDEGTLYKEHAISLGIPLNAISTTNKVVNTAQEAIEIRRNLNSLNSSPKILLVTSAFL